jgi:hypothetical protein
MDIFILILPGLVAIIGNIIFYLIVKKRIDKSIEKHKISYSGIFKEKISIYKELLTKIYSIKKNINQFHYAGTDELGKQCFSEINDFINFYLANQPFLSDKILENLKNIRIEFQEAFDAFYMYHKDPTKGLNKSVETDFIYKQFLEAGNKLKKDDPFKDLESFLITEIRQDIRINDL